MNGSVRCRLLYDGDQLAEPLLFRLGHGSAIQVEVLSEIICARQGTVRVALRGAESEVAGALAHLRLAGIGVEIDTRP